MNVLPAVIAVSILILLTILAGSYFKVQEPVEFLRLFIPQIVVIAFVCGISLLGGK